MSERVSNMSDATFISDAEVIDEKRGENSLAAPLHGRLRLVTGAVIAFILFAFPLFFGGVHEASYLPLHAVLFTLFGCIAMQRPSPLALFDSETHPVRCTRLIVCSLSALILYASAQYFWLTLSHSPHPVTGIMTEAVNSLSTFRAIREIVFVTVLFITVRLYLGRDRASARRLVHWITGSGFIVGVVSLSHWFYDNGKLFWIFAPESVFQSPRARWPFVNSNHLGDYLDPILFLVLAGFVTLYFRFVDIRTARGRRRVNSLATLLADDRLHARLTRPLVLILPFLAVTLAIFASLSRGAWLGLSAGLILFVLLMRLFREVQRVPSEGVNINLIEFPRTEEKGRSGRRRRTRRSEPNEMMNRIIGALPRFAKPILIVGALTLLVFFLNERGRELVSGRIEYGLIHSKDDMRWTFYSDSLRMFQEHPLLGIGLGTWLDRYPQYVDPLLSGLNPVYLHSDPLQALIELGVLGVIPILFLVSVVIVFSLSALRKMHSLEDSLTLKALLCGLIALGISSFPEFPFRIPAITALFAILLALTAFYADRSYRDSSNQ